MGVMPLVLTAEETEEVLQAYAWELDVQLQGMRDSVLRESVQAIPVRVSWRSG